MNSLFLENHARAGREARQGHPQPIVKRDAFQEGGCAFKVLNCLYGSSQFFTPSINQPGPLRPG